jgi:hypothetical protein
VEELASQLASTQEALEMEALPAEPPQELVDWLAGFGDADDDDEEGVWAPEGAFARRPAAGARQ